MKLCFSQQGHTSLIVAGNNGHVGIVMSLLTDSDIKVNIDHHENERLDTALTRSAGMGRVEVVRVLLEHGASVNVVNKSNSTALNLR